jgi:hypothetical protein
MTEQPSAQAKQKAKKKSKGKASANAEPKSFAKGKKKPAPAPDIELTASPAAVAGVAEQAIPEPQKPNGGGLHVDAAARFEPQTLTPEQREVLEKLSANLAGRL